MCAFQVGHIPQGEIKLLNNMGILRILGASGQRFPLLKAANFGLTHQ